MTDVKIAPNAVGSPAIAPGAVGNLEIVVVDVDIVLEGGGVYLVTDC